MALIEDPLARGAMADLSRSYSYTIPTQGGLQSINHQYTYPLHSNSLPPIFNDSRVSAHQNARVFFTKQNASFEATLLFLNKKKYEINLCIVILIDIFDEIGL